MSTNPNKIAEVRRKQKVTQQELADRLGVHVITVSKLERGVMQLTSSWLERLAKALNVSESQIWGGFTPKHLEANGYLFSNGRIEVTDPEDNIFVTYLEPLGDMNSKWLLVRDDSLLPYFGTGDLLQFSLIAIQEIHETHILDGRLCMYGDKQALGPKLAIMEKYKNTGIYDLRALNGHQMKDVEVNVIWYLSGYQPAWGLGEIRAVAVYSDDS